MAGFMARLRAGGRHRKLHAFVKMRDSFVIDCFQRKGTAVVKK